MDPFSHTVALLSLPFTLGEHCDRRFVSTPQLDALPSRTYINFKLAKVNGVWTSAYMRQKYNSATFEEEGDE